MKTRHRPHTRETRTLAALLSVALLLLWRSTQAATLELTTPIGGELYTNGDSITIEWKMRLDPGDHITHVTLFYIWGGESRENYITDVMTDLLDGSYTWSIPYVSSKSFLRIRAVASVHDMPGDVARDTSYHVKIVPNRYTPAIHLRRPQPPCNAFSDSCATPLVLRAGQVYTVRWDITGCVFPFVEEPLQILFSTNGGFRWEVVSTLPSACDSSAFSWRVPDVATRRGKIRLMWGAIDSSTSVHCFEIAESPPPRNHAPVARAGSDQRVPEGALVHLDGMRSSDRDPGDRLTHSWVRIDTLGAWEIDLRDADTPTPWFLAPDGMRSELPFRFSLTVTDDAGAYSSDEVQVTVRPGLPRITRFSPAEGWDKTPITLRGTNLSGCEVYLHGELAGTTPHVGHDRETILYLREGLPLGPTPIRITRGGSSFTTTEEFTVLRAPYQWDWGFSFHNPTVDNLSWTDYENAFGDAVNLFIFGGAICCDWSGLRCVRQCHDPLAQLLWDRFYRDLAEPGLCWGMCKQSLTYYYGDSDLLFGLPPREYRFSLAPETLIARHIKRAHLQQVSAEVIHYLVRHHDDTPLEVLAQIEAATSLDPPQPGVIGLANVDAGGSVLEIVGHALVPDRVVQVSPDEWRIYVYDPNREALSLSRDVTDTRDFAALTDPNSYPFIRVRRTSGIEAWSFEMAETPGRPGDPEIWSGDSRASIDVSGSGRTFIEIPYFGFTYYPEDLVRGPHHLPTSPEGLFVIIFGAADGGVENEKGERLGYDRKGNLHMEIQGALPVVPLGGARFSESEVYYLPDGTCRSRVYGRERGQYSWTALHRDMLFAIEDADVRASSRDIVDLDADGRSLTFRTRDASKRYSVKITTAVEVQEARYQRVFELVDTSLSRGNSATFWITTDNRSLVYENHGKNPVKFSARLSQSELSPQPEPPDVQSQGESPLRVADRLNQAGLSPQPEPPDIPPEELEATPAEDHVLLVEDIELPAHHVLILAPSDWDDLGRAEPKINLLPLGLLKPSILKIVLDPNAVNVR